MFRFSLTYCTLHPKINGYFKKKGGDDINARFAKFCFGKQKLFSHRKLKFRDKICLELAPVGNLQDMKRNSIEKIATLKLYRISY